MKKRFLVLGLSLLLVCGLTACGQAEYVHDGENDPGPPYSFSFRSLAEYAAYINNEPDIEDPGKGMVEAEMAAKVRQAMEAVPFPVAPGAELTSFGVTWREENNLGPLRVRYETPAGESITFTIPMAAAGQEEMEKQITRGKKLPTQHMDLLRYSSKTKTKDKSPIYVYHAQVDETLMMIRAATATKDDAAQILAEVEFGALADLCQIKEDK